MERTKKEVKLSDVIFDETIYPRKSHYPEIVQQYVDQMAGIEAAGAYPVVAADMRLLDGKHRWLAYRTIYETAPDTMITVYQEDIANENAMIIRSIELNNNHGKQLSPEDKKQDAIRLYGLGYTNETICKALSVGHTTLSSWLSRTRKEEKNKRDQVVIDMWQRCYTTTEIAEAVGETQPNIISNIKKILEDEIYITSGYPDTYKPALYNVWKKQNKSNGVKHFGNSELEWVDNLIYKYTQPGDIVVDPFGGGGSTLDLCRKRWRRCWIGDRKPIVSRETEIRKHDLVADAGAIALPNLRGRWGDVKLVYLDPPYWKQAEGKYDRQSLHAYCVLYAISEEENPRAPGIKDINGFRVKKLWPENHVYKDWKVMSPRDWAQELLRIRLIAQNQRCGIVA